MSLFQAGVAGDVVKGAPAIGGMDKTGIIHNGGWLDKGGFGIASDKTTILKQYRI